MQSQETVAPPPLALQPAAVERIRALRKSFEKPDGGLRLRIIAGGCSGMQYRIDFAETPRANDLIVAAEDVKVFVDPKSLTYVKGSSLDYWEDLLGGGFKVVNPNAKSACSCGVSFSV
ncbi:MAG TPA: iron-sulfur cluster assembly accessory protein [Thermoplasmata archaeon]|nr:iron-sulfur cluster assembly accessory protein [Thermoplasmata archaeon]